jgi:hypothetical protein
MKAVCGATSPRSFETPVSHNPPTKHHIPEKASPQHHWCETFITRIPRGGTSVVPLDSCFKFDVVKRDYIYSLFEMRPRHSRNRRSGDSIRIVSVARSIRLRLTVIRTSIRVPKRRKSVRKIDHLSAGWSVLAGTEFVRRHDTMARVHQGFAGGAELVQNYLQP